MARARLETILLEAAQVRAQVRGPGRLIVPNRLGLPDPAFGKTKALVIVFSLRGKVYTAAFGQNQTYRLPG